MSAAFHTALMMRLHEATDLLGHALFNMGPHRGAGPVIRAAAHVANLALMLADNADRAMGPTMASIVPDDGDLSGMREVGPDNIDHTTVVNAVFDIVKPSPDNEHTRPATPP